MSLAADQEPAHAVLAADLLGRGCALDRQTESSRLSSAIPDIDTILLGGQQPFESGQVALVALEQGVRSGLASRLAHGLLAAHLTASASGQRRRRRRRLPGRAFYLDCTGDFAPRQLYDQVLAQLRHTTSHSVSDAQTVDWQQRAVALLERVSCIRVLDHAGALEALDEVGSTLLGRPLTPEPAEDDANAKSDRVPDILPPRVVADSQASLDSDDAELLDEPAGSLGRGFDPSCKVTAEAYVHEDTNNKVTFGDSDEPDESHGPPLLLLSGFAPLMLPYLAVSGSSIHGVDEARTAANARAVELLHRLRLLASSTTTHPDRIGACCIIFDDMTSVGGSRFHSLSRGADQDQNFTTAKQAVLASTPAMHLVDLALAITNMRLPHHLRGQGRPRKVQVQVVKDAQGDRQGRTVISTTM